MGTEVTIARLSVASSSWCARLMAPYTARSMTHSLQSVTASTVAARGALYSSASSPKPLRACNNEHENPHAVVMHALRTDPRHAAHALSS